MNSFRTYHPIINFVYFAIVIVLGMFLLHPVLLGIGLIASFSYALILKGKATLKFFGFVLLPMMILIIIANPIFNGQGNTVLTYIFDRPITMESLTYGIVTAFMFATILLWFSCYNDIMTSDKFVYLFGRIMPSISLIFSMVMRFIPKFREQIKVVSKAQKCIGRDVSNGKLMDKAKHGIRILSIMTTWALENAVDTADSMRSRGYGIKGRTAFSIYRFDGRDSIVTLIMVFLVGVIILGLIFGAAKAEYFPSINIETLNSMSSVFYMAYFLLCFLPIILDVKEELKWRFLQLKI